MYALVLVEPRYIAAFFTLFWVGLFSGIVIPKGREAVRTASLITIIVVFVIAAPVGLFGESLVENPSRRTEYRLAGSPEPGTLWCQTRRSRRTDRRHLRCELGKTASCDGGRRGSSR